MVNFILIDGSYYIYYRYYSLIKWWGFAKKETLIDIHNNQEFINKYKNVFINKLKEIPKKLKIKNAILIVAKDCRRRDIWRTEIFEEYKSGRKQDSSIAHFFKMVYDEQLFENTNISAIISYPHLEADDCIALTAKFIEEKYSNEVNKIYIMTSDMDYLQLASDKILIYNMQYIQLITSKNSTGNAAKDLFCKIVIGDKSDNIPSVFKKCSLKNAIEYFDNPDKFKEKMSSTDGAQERFDNNKILIDFKYIPEHLQVGFKKDILLIK